MSLQFRKRLLPAWNDSGELMLCSTLPGLARARPVDKDGEMYYAFFPPRPASWKGQLELRGLAPRKYHVRDYAEGKDLGLAKSVPPAKFPAWMLSSRTTCCWRLGNEFAGLLCAEELLHVSPISEGLSSTGARGGEAS